MFPYTILHKLLTPVSTCAQTQNTVYEIVSDMSSRQDSFEERLVSLEGKLTALQEQVEMLPEALTRSLAQHAERLEQRRNFLHPDTAAIVTPGCGGLGIGMPGGTVASHHPLGNLVTSPLLPHSRSVPSAPSTASLHPWPASPVLPPISSRTPHLVPETGRHHGAISHQPSAPTTSQSSSGLGTNNQGPGPSAPS